MATVTKKDLVDRISTANNLKRGDVKATIQAFLDEIVEELSRGNRLEFRDFGVFETKERAPRMAQNPKTLQRVPVPAKRTVKFKVGRKMKMQLDEATGQPDNGHVDRSEVKPVVKARPVRETAENGRLVRA